MNALIQFILKLIGQGGAARVEKMIKDVLLKKGTGGGSPLDDLMNQFKDKGLGDIFKSWVGTGSNSHITPDQIKHGIGSEQMAAMSAQSGMSQDVLAQKLSQYLPGLIDKMTPNGRT